jgi:hypothetical protein
VRGGGGGGGVCVGGWCTGGGGGAMSPSCVCMCVVAAVVVMEGVCVCVRGAGGGGGGGGWSSRWELPPRVAASAAASVAGAEDPVSAASSASSPAATGRSSCGRSRRASGRVRANRLGWMRLVSVHIYMCVGGGGGGVGGGGVGGGGGELYVTLTSLDGTTVQKLDLHGPPRRPAGAPRRLGRGWRAGTRERVVLVVRSRMTEMRTLPAEEPVDASCRRGEGEKDREIGGGGGG